MRGILLDSDFVISLGVQTETTHARAKNIALNTADIPQFMLRIISYELATVLSRRQDHATAVAVLNSVLGHVQLLDIADLEEKIWQEFRSHQKRHISFFDCANLVAARHYDFKIASFDHFYPKELLA